jgi:hypothetical protein
LSLRQKILYHQIHWAKITVDVTSGVLSTWLMWTHDFWVGMAVAWVPPVVVSSFMLWQMDFSRQRDSRFGRYIAFHMTHAAEAVRICGQIAVWIGAWYHSVWAIAVGCLIVILGWSYSLPAWRSRALKGVTS